MIKRVIFDLDDTIFNSAPYYKLRITKGLVGTIYENNEEVINEIDESFGYYEEVYPIYTNENYVNFFNKKYHREMTKEIFEKINRQFDKSDDLKSGAKEILEYLSQKYEIVALTNYLYDVQIARLKIVKLYSYFKAIYAGDKNACKPSIESYRISCGNFSKEECIIIGDNLQKDYLKPIEYGMKAILYDECNRYEEKHFKISKLEDIKKYL